MTSQMSHVAPQNGGGFSNMAWQRSGRVIHPLQQQMSPSYHTNYAAFPSTSQQHLALSQTLQCTANRASCSSLTVPNSIGSQMNTFSNNNTSCFNRLSRVDDYPKVVDNACHNAQQLSSNPTSLDTVEVHPHAFAHHHHHPLANEANSQQQSAQTHLTGNVDTDGKAAVSKPSHQQPHYEDVSDCEEEEDPTRLFSLSPHKTTVTSRRTSCDDMPPLVPIKTVMVEAQQQLLSPETGNGEEDFITLTSSVKDTEPMEEEDRLRDIASPELEEVQRVLDTNRSFVGAGDDDGALEYKTAEISNNTVLIRNLLTRLYERGKQEKAELIYSVHRDEFRAVIKELSLENLPNNGGMMRKFVPECLRIAKRCLNELRELYEEEGEAMQFQHGIQMLQVAPISREITVEESRSNFAAQRSLYSTSIESLDSLAESFESESSACDTPLPKSDATALSSKTSSDNIVLLPVVDTPTKTNNRNKESDSSEASGSKLQDIVKELSVGLSANKKKNSEEVVRIFNQMNSLGEWSLSRENIQYISNYYGLEQSLVKRLYKVCTVNRILNESKN